jgi:hypothetical protein
MHPVATMNLPAGGHGLGIRRAENNTSNATPASLTNEARSLWN